MRVALSLALGLLAAAPATSWAAAAGSFDPTFGDGGRVRTVLDGYAFAQAIVRQTDGKLVAAGFTSATVNGFRTIALVRYEADGTLDGSFGDAGIVRTTLGTYPTVQSLLLQPDGKLVVLVFSTSTPSRFALLRYDTAGVLDPTFDGDGIAEPDVGQNVDATGAALQSDGSIVVVADTSFGVGTPTGDDVYVIRVDDTGALDGTFGTGGVSTIDFAGGRRDDGVALVIQPDGAIVVLGYAWVDQQHLRDGADVALARVSATGSPDGAFGTAGVVLQGFGKADWASSIVLLGDGSLLVSGASNTFAPDTDYNITSSEGFLLRFTSAGVLDATYGTGGVVWLDGRMRAGTLLAGPGGTAVMVDTSSTAAFRLAQAVGRRLADGSADAEFGDDGVVIAQLGEYDSTAIAGVVDPSGNVVAAGWDSEPCTSTFDPYGLCYHFGLARYLGAVAPCTSDDDCGPCESCGATGACGFGPRTTCAPALPNRSSLYIDEPWQKPAKHGVRFKWRGTTPAGFDPQTDDAGICLYLDDHRALVAQAPASGTCGGTPCWAANRSGISYKDRDQTPDGIQKMRITPTIVKVNALGENLLETMHGLPFPAVVEQGYGAIRAQVHLGGTCVDVNFTHVTTRFVAVEQNTYTWTQLRASGP